MVTIRYILSSHNGFSIIINLSSIIFTTNTNCDIIGCTFRNFYSNYNWFAFLSFPNSNIHRSIILRSSDVSLNSSIGMIVITGVDYFNFMVSRSYIGNINDCSTVNHSSIECFITNFNCYITCSIITNNNNNSTITIINNYRINNRFSTFSNKFTNSIIASEVIVTRILNNKCLSTTSQVFKVDYCFSIVNLSSVIHTVNSDSHITGSILRHSHSNNRSTIHNITNNHIHRSIILRSSNVGFYS